MAAAAIKVVTPLVIPPGIPHVTSTRYKDGVKTEDGLLEYGGYYDQFPERRKTEYFGRGKWTHAANDAWAKGGEPTIEETLALINRNHPDWDTSEWPGFHHAYRAWWAFRKPRLVACAVKVYAFLGDCWQGELDQLVMLGDDLTLIEEKTGTHPKCCPLQTAAYAIGLYQTTGQQVKKRLGLELHSDGTFKEFPHNNYRDHDNFRILARCYHMHGPNSREYR